MKIQHIAIIYFYKQYPHKKKKLKTHIMIECEYENMYMGSMPVAGCTTVTYSISVYYALVFREKNANIWEPKEETFDKKIASLWGGIHGVGTHERMRDLYATWMNFGRLKEKILRKSKAKSWFFLG